MVVPRLRGGGRGGRRIKLQAVNDAHDMAGSALALEPRYDVGPLISDRIGCIAALMGALVEEMGAQWSQLLWHGAGQPPASVFEAGSRPAGWPDRAAIDEFGRTLLRAGEGPLAGRGAGAALSGAMFPMASGSFTLLVLVTHEPVPRAGQAAMTLARLGPLLRPFLFLWSDADAARRRTITAILESADTPIAVLDGASRVMVTNASADAFVATGRNLVRSGDRLRAATLTDTLRLQAAVEHCCGGDRGTGGACVITLARSRQRPLLVSLTPLDLEDGSGALAVVSVFDPDQDLAHLLGPACQYYGLSPSETRLTCKLIEGCSLSEAAASLGIRAQTARSYLKQVFAKTETNRQAELVLLMVRSAVRVRPRDRMPVY